MNSLGMRDAPLQVDSVTGRPRLSSASRYPAGPELASYTATQPGWANDHSLAGEEGLLVAVGWHGMWHRMDGGVETEVPAAMSGLRAVGAELEL